MSNCGHLEAIYRRPSVMKKIALIAALPFALALAACGDSTPEAADGDATTAEATDDAMATDTSAVGPTDTTPAGRRETNDETVERLDETAEDLEERADDIESTNEAEADRLEAEAKRLQKERDVRD